METFEIIAKCEICEKTEKNLSLYSANHKELGWIKVCRDCWIKLYEDNKIVADSGSSSKSSSSPCNSCSGCQF